MGIRIYYAMLLLLSVYTVQIVSEIHPDMDVLREESFAATKNSWCETRPFNQTIRMKFCKDKNISNRMCLGECLSYFLPNKEQNAVACFACMPSRETTRLVSLKCPDHPISKIQRVVVPIVVECRCKQIELKLPGPDSELL